MIDFLDVKDSLLLFLFSLLILATAFISLFILRALVFLVIHYHAVEGITFSLIRLNWLRLIKDIFPFAILCSIITSFVRMYKKPGIIWVSYLFLFIITGTVWFTGYRYFEPKHEKNDGENPVSFLFSGYIHDTDSARMYVHRKIEAEGYERIIIPLQDNPDQPQLHLEQVTETVPLSPANPIFSPIIAVSSMFNAIIDELSFFSTELHTLYQQQRVTFIIVSIEILAFFIFSGTLIRLSKFPLFLVVMMIAALRFFFYTFTQFSTGIPALLLEIVLPWNLYPPLIGIGYFSLVLFLISIRYTLVHPRTRRETIQ